MASVMPASPLDRLPFERLAAAMHRDAARGTMEDWADFLDYCEGATVAPTFVFLLLLASDDDGHSVVGAGQLWPHARTLGIYCYIVHIMRDLEKDADAGSHLLTIPRSHFADLADDLEQLAAALLDSDSPARQALVERLGHELGQMSGEAARSVQALDRVLPPDARDCLSRIMAHYRGLAIEIGGLRPTQPFQWASQPPI